MKQGTFLLVVAIFVSFSTFAQKEDLSEVWPTKWVMPQNAPAKEYSVHHFRTSFEVDRIPDSLVVHTSGDNRYQLFVNGKMVTWGPLRGDLRHWYYETTDIAPYLIEGKNVLAAVVLNYGSHPPDAQHSVQTGFLLAADNKKFRFLNTSDKWKAIYSPAYSPSMVTKDQVNGYYGGGSREIVDGNQYIWGWQSIEFDDTNWDEAKEIENAYAKGCKWAGRWKLTPRKLVHEKLTPERFQQVRIAENVEIPDEFPQQAIAFTIPENTTGRFVLDRGHLTTSYPILKISGGENAEIKFTYVEAPYIGAPSKKQKGNRNEVEGKNFIGYFDKFIADGGQYREFKPIWWRTYRYIEVSFKTAEKPLKVHDISGIYSSYPFVQKAKFGISGQQINSGLIEKIIETGHRTILANAHEHFTDCPYYEESQFEGDTRVECLVSYLNYDDPALATNAIEQFSWSVNDEGFLSARYPTNSLYYIPNFSIYWIGMLYDYMMFVDDVEFVRSKLPIVRYLLTYFEKHERENGTLERLDYHQFVDWSFKAGEPPFDKDDYSALVDLHYLMALQWAAKLEKEGGESYYKNKYQEKIKKITQSIRTKYWNQDIGLFTDVPNNSEKLSQHTNCLAILTGVSSGTEAKQIMQKVLANKEMIKATLYWQFYVFEAMQQAGLGNEYLNHLDVWKEVLDLGATTWPETGPNSRSECHGWGASPNYHLYKIMAGVSPDAPGFKKIKIEPNLGDSEKLEVEIPHPCGTIKMNLSRKDKSLKGNVELPKGTSGIFIWEGMKKDLKSGSQLIVF